MTRVIVLTTHAERVGGIERVTRTLLLCLAGHHGADRVGVLSVWAQETDQPCVVLHSGRGVDGGRVGLRSKIAFMVGAVAGALRWRRGLVVVACHPHLAPVAWLTRLLTRAPFVVWCHGEEVWGRVRRIVAWSARRADVIFAPSRFTADRVEHTMGLRRGSIEVIPHCVPPEVANPARADSFNSRRAVTVARLAPEHAYKGVDELLRAWPKVLAAVDGAELVVVGEGPDRPRLTAMVRDLGIERSVRFAGRVSDNDLPSYYSSAALFVLPSRTRLTPRPEGEGFGLVYVEAGAAGLPVVALRGGAVPEVVVDGVTGVLVDSAAPDSLSGAIIDLLTDPERARRLGEAGRRRASDEYGYERFCERIASLIASLRPLPEGGTAIRGRQRLSRDGDRDEP